MKKTCLTLAAALCCVAALGAMGCEDVSIGTTTTLGPDTSATVGSDSTTTLASETTTTVASTTTTAAAATTATSAKATTSTAAKTGPAPKEHLLKGTWEWDVDADATPDVWYEIVDELVHYLVPENGAGFARISGKSFTAVGLSDLQGIKNYSSAGLATESVDDPNVLMPGSVIALRTGSGRYAKLEVIGFEPVTVSEGMVISRYNIRLRYVLYP